MPSFATFSESHNVEIEPIKKSRFFAHGAPVSSVEMAMHFVQSVREVQPDASHYCYAWRLSGGGTRVWDDGEPAGTGGKPILARLEGNNLYDVIIVVTRFYGGTKLGKGGLIRAYGGGATELIAASTIRMVRMCSVLPLSLSYADQGVVHSIARAMGVEVLSESFGSVVSLELSVPVEVADEFAAQVTERTSGRVRVASPEP